MAGVNKCILLGHLGKDPEVRQTNSGDRIVNLRLAVSESWRDKTTGERKERTEWVSVVIFNEGLGKIAEQYLKKGSQVYLEGQLQTRKWTDKEGVEKYTTEVVLQRYRGELTLLGGRQSSDDGDGDAGGGSPMERRPDTSADDYRRAKEEPQRQAPANGGSGRYADLDDDVPFAPEWRA